MELQREDVTGHKALNKKKAQICRRVSDNASGCNYMNNTLIEDTIAQYQFLCRNLQYMQSVRVLIAKRNQQQQQEGSLEVLRDTQ